MHSLKKQHGSPIQASKVCTDDRCFYTKKLRGRVEHKGRVEQKRRVDELKRRGELMSRFSVKGKKCKAVDA